MAMLLAVASCGGGGAPAATPATPAPVVAPTPPPGDGAEGCRPAYAEYERRWRIALTEEMAAIEGGMEPDAIESIVVSQVETLPNREELAKLRTVYGVVELFLAQESWPMAFAAADRAIESCGESAKRPQ